MYDDIDNIPSGVTISDANNILPESEVWYYKKGFNKGSPSGFSNHFRYKFLYERGGCWTDTDIVMDRSSDHLPDMWDYYFISQWSKPLRRQQVTSSFICTRIKKAPIFKSLVDYCKSRNIDRVIHGETGPDILDKIVNKYSLDKYVLHYDAFQSIDYDEIEKIFTSGVLKYELIGMHLCDSVWNEKGYTLDMAEKSSVMNYFIKKYGTES